MKSSNDSSQKANKTHKQISRRLHNLFLNKQIDEFIREADTLLANGVDLQKLSTKDFDIPTKYTEMKILMQRFLSIYPRMSESIGWNNRQISDNSTIGVKIQGTTIEIKYEAQLSANIQNLCIMLYLTHLYSEFVPFCKESINVNQISSLEKIAFLRFTIPFVSDRCAYFHGMGLDRIEENSTLIICGQGITKDSTKLNKYSIDPTKTVANTVVLDLKYFICQISHSQNGFLFRSYAQIDTHLPFLPGWLVNTLIKQVGGYVIQRIVERAKNLQGTVWEKQVKNNFAANERFYVWLHRRIQNWKKEKGKKPSL